MRTTNITSGRGNQYWESESAWQLAFTRVSLLGFVRLLTNLILQLAHCRQAESRLSNAPKAVARRHPNLLAVKTGQERV